MKERIEALVNPKMLEWARKSIRFDIFGAAKKIGTKPERLKEWESGAKKPTINQAIKMAEVYKSGLISHERRVEIFCNHAAGSVLIPKEYLEAHEVVRNHGRKPEWDQKEIEKLSSDFSTSNEAVVRRLLINGLTTKKFYERKRKEYIDKWDEGKRKKKEEKEDFRIRYHRVVLHRIGKPFTRAVFRVYHDHVITLSDVSDYIGEKVTHFKDLESEA